MRLINHSSVPVYTVSGSSTARPLPDWLVRKRKRTLKKDPEFANRIELLQDFEFEEASCCVRVSDDAQWVMSTGTYKPQIHTHYLPHLSLSFARHTSSLNSTFLLLSSDYSKSLHLQIDRSLEFHTPHGCHYTTRIPRYGRDLVYDRRSAEALVPAVGVNGDGNGEVFRLNLEIGRFMRAYEVDVGGEEAPLTGRGPLQGEIGIGSVNAAAVAEESHNLLAFGTSLGTVECWDSRSRSRVGLLSIPAEFQSTPAVSAVEFHRSGLTMATGTSSGLVYLYDLRSPVPLLKKDQGYGHPIQSLIFLTPSSASRAQTSEPKILSADKKIIKIWNPNDGAAWTSVEPAVDINSVAWCKDSGMILTANEGRQQHSFFIPQLGPAPKWCGFLDALVEEMAEDPNDPNAFKSGGEVYDNYKFLTAAQLRTLNLDHLVGRSNLLRPYMHGYFVAQRLYEEARLIADPFMLEEERAKRVKQKIDKERESRIRGVKNKVKVKVNKDLAAKVLAREEKRRASKALKAEGREDDEREDGGREGDDKSQAPDADRQPLLLRDTRFSALFQDADFEVDENSREFQQLNPSTARSEARGRTAVEDEEEEMAERKQLSIDDDDSDNEDEDDENTDDDDDDNKSEPNPKRPSRNPGAKDDRTRSTTKRPSTTNVPTSKTSPQLSRPAAPSTKKAELRMITSASQPLSRASRSNKDNQTFGSRLAESQSNTRQTPSHARSASGQGASFLAGRRFRDNTAGTVHGDREITFTVSSSKRAPATATGAAGGGGGGGGGGGEGGRGGDRGGRANDASGQGSSARQQRRDEGRRSASGNVLRRMGA